MNYCFSNKCLNVLIEIKNNFNSIINEFKFTLNENQMKTIEELEMKYKSIESEKQQIFGNNCENNCKTSNQCFESQNIGSNNKRKTRRDSLEEKTKRRRDVKYKKQLIERENEVLLKLQNRYSVSESLKESLETIDNSVESDSTDIISEKEINLTTNSTQNDNQLSDVLIFESKCELNTKPIA